MITTLPAEAADLDLMAFEVRQAEVRQAVDAIRRAAPQGQAGRLPSPSHFCPKMAAPMLRDPGEDGDDDDLSCIHGAAFCRWAANSSAGLKPTMR